MGDENVQKKGAVFVFYHVDVNNNDRRVIYATAKLKNAIPVKIASIHLCYNEPKLRSIVEIALTVLGPHERVRYRAHYGTYEVYNLKC
jgi:hypothetical protein